MTTPQYVDISSFQPANIDWKAYKQWAAGFDGFSRVAIRSSEGVGVKDANFDEYRQGALSVGIDSIIIYHYAYPQYNQALAEADYQRSIVGSIRQNDVIMLDYEEVVNQATPQWALDWLTTQEQNYSKLPVIYSYDNYIRTKLQDNRLVKFPLVYALWQYSPTERPPCPPPWTSYQYLQYTDKATNIPGINAPVDADIYLGVEPPKSDVLYQFTQEEIDAWNYTKLGLSMQTGIAMAWSRAWRAGHVIGSPMGGEIHTVNKQGVALIRQVFAHADAEHIAPETRFYDGRGYIGGF